MQLYVEVNAEIEYKIHVKIEYKTSIGNNYSLLMQKSMSWWYDLVQ